MKLYKVIHEGNELHFLAEDMDHVITLLSQLVGTIDYLQLVAEAAIEQVAGPITDDEAHFYGSMSY